MNRTARVLVTAGLGLAYLGLLLGAISPVPIGVVLLTAVLVAAEVVLTRFAPELLPALFADQLNARFRLLSVDLLVGVFAARTHLPALLVALAVTALVLLHLTRDADGIFTRRIEWRRAGGPVSWRNLHVPGLPMPRTARPQPELSVALAVLTLVLPLGLAFGEWLHDRAVPVVAALTVIAACIVLLLVRGSVLAWTSRRSRDAVRAALRAAIDDAAPQVVLHFSGRRGTAGQAADWAPTLRWLTQRCLIVTRESTHLDALAATGLPVVFAPLSTDVELFMVRSVQLALYPSDVTNINNHLLRVPGIYDVLIGHGDSDEAENSSPIARMYDEIWVAGPLGRARYATPLTGVRDSRVREIGPLPFVAREASPQPDVADAGAWRRRTVVYAPAWESVLTTTNLSSLRTVSRRIVSALLKMPDVQVVLAPAPATGSRLPEYARELESLTERIREAGAPHLVASPHDSPSALAHADLVITDVSPVVADAVELDRPYAVPARPFWTPAQMLQAYPSLRGGTVLETERGADLRRQLTVALAADTMAEERAVLRRELMGPYDPLQFQARFQAAVDDALAAQAARRTFLRPAAAPVA
ncbi:hypothetical protein [uncultured Amnibacterium sp.]|uniref:hypothetical protein n=1 Tax=uncultured Amnibacterium sp. TaxID=1631851 RepID=UPI0035CA8B4A